VSKDRFLGRGGETLLSISEQLSAELDDVPKEPNDFEDDTAD
jgi:hypothetical protein